MGVKIEIEDVFEIFVYDPNFDFVLHQPNLVLTPTHIEQWEAKSWWKENVDEILGCSAQGDYHTRSQPLPATMISPLRTYQKTSLSMKGPSMHTLSHR